MTDPPIFDDTYDGPRWTYGLTYRPLTFGAVPVGYIVHSNRPHPTFRFGTVQYPRRLTDSEVEHAELARVGQPDASELIRWPFPLPERFVDELGYGRTVAAFESPALRAQLAELVRRQDLDADLDATVPTGPRRYLALWWEPAGDKLAWSDGAYSGAGQLNHWALLDYLHGMTTALVPGIGGSIYGWLVEHQVDLGSSDAPATHALVVDTESLEAHVAPIMLARRIVRAQTLSQSPAA